MSIEEEMRNDNKVIMFCATGCNVGLVPVIPGTFGTLVGLPLCFLLSIMAVVPGLVFIAAFILFAIYVSHRAQIIVKRQDPGCIVIDEMAGLMITLYGLPFELYTVIVGFILFRMLDIIKPFPIDWLERKLSGGLGVVTDDLAAGILGNILLRLGWLFYNG